MKKLGKILSLVVILVMMTATFAFADAAAGAGKLVLDSTYPKDGATGTAIENMGIKLYFNDATFTQSKLGDTNDNNVTLTDEEGNKLPTMVLYSTQESGVVLVLFDSNADEDVTIQQNSNYTITVSGDFVDDNGNTLGKAQSVTFKTVNQNLNMLINTGMMFGMFGIIMVVSAKGAQKQASQNAQQKEGKVNPYKEAKKTGKSVEEIVEKDQREKAKRAEKAARKAAAQAEEDEDEYYDDGNYHVKGPRPISAAGGKYITGRKAIAEAKKAEEEKRKAWEEKAKKGKGKGKKK